MAVIGVASWDSNEFYGLYSCPQSYWGKYYMAMEIRLMFEILHVTGSSVDDPDAYM